MDRQKSQHSTSDQPFFGQHTVGAHEMQLSATAFGGQLLSWRADGRERLFCGPSTLMTAGTPIRGGVPVIFPQFAAWGDGARHGFARLLPWRQEIASTPDSLSFVLEDSPATRKQWPHGFRLTLVAKLAPRQLELSLAVENTGLATFDFTTALHTYLAVDDVAQVRIMGLTGNHYHDAPSGSARVDSEGILGLDDEEIDRIYRDIDTDVQLREGGHGLDIGMTGFRDLVIWNPGEQKSRQINDLAPGDERRFICIEAARVMSPVSLGPGQSWQGVQTLSVPRSL